MTPEELTSKLHCADPGAPLAPAPEWARYLVRVGWHVAEHDRNNPLTVAVSLPRIDFAAAFLSLGIALATVAKTAAATGVDGWRALVGRRVKYVNAYGHVAEGVLLEPDDSYPEYLWVNKGGLKTNVCPEHRPTIQLAPIQMRSAGKRKPSRENRPIDADAAFDALAKLFSPVQVADWLSNGAVTTAVVGRKARLEEELSIHTSLWTDRNGDSISLRALLQIASSPEASGHSKALLLPVTSFEDCDVAGPVVIEASSIVNSHLDRVSSHNCIVPLGRNAAWYTDAMEAIMNRYYHRKQPDAAIPFRAPPHIYTLAFHHS